MALLSRGAWLAGNFDQFRPIHIFGVLPRLS
jgi:hypothetical protein